MVKKSRNPVEFLGIRQDFLYCGWNFMVYGSGVVVGTEKERLILFSLMVCGEIRKLILYL